MEPNQSRLILRKNRSYESYMLTLQEPLSGSIGSEILQRLVQKFMA